MKQNIKKRFYLRHDGGDFELSCVLYDGIDMRVNLFNLEEDFYELLFDISETLEDILDRLYDIQLNNLDYKKSDEIDRFTQNALNYS